MSAAVIILRRKRFIRRFVERGATGPDRAIYLAEVGMRRSWIFDQMISRGVFVRVGPDRFYVQTTRPGSEIPRYIPATIAGVFHS